MLDAPSPMLFNTKMVQAILSGQKTETRRLVPNWQLPQKIDEGDNAYISIAQRHARYGFGVFGGTPELCMGNYNKEYQGLCPYVNELDLIWVRETTERTETPDGPVAAYVADGELVRGPDGAPVDWDYPRAKRPSIHMPKAYARLILKATSVRVAQLKDITEDACAREGCPGNGEQSAMEHFKEVWESTGDAWDDKTWVWVIKFERTSEGTEL